MHFSWSFSPNTARARLSFRGLVAAAIGVAALATALVMAPGAAAQGAGKADAGGWKVCNQTSYVLEAAAAPSRPTWTATDLLADLKRA